MLEGATYNPKWHNDPKEYLDAKLEILVGDFRITPTESEMAHLQTLKTQIAIDQAILALILNH